MQTYPALSEMTGYLLVSLDVSSDTHFGLGMTYDCAFVAA